MENRSVAEDFDMGCEFKLGKTGMPEKPDILDQTGKLYSLSRPGNPCRS
jgi:hypothetical protein